MKRTISILSAALTIGASFAVTAPAHAEDAPPWPLSCLEDAPPGPGFQTVYFDDQGRLIVNPEGAPGDVSAWSDHLPDLLLALRPCLLEPLPLGPATCLSGKVLEIVNSLDPLNTNLRYVYPNPNGPGVAIDYQLLINDAFYGVNCV